jgi:co-chaperonin GroES (HSP10)
MSYEKRKCVQDFVLCKEVDELDRRARMTPGSEIVPPTMYEVVGGSRDKMFIGEVVDTGPGVTVLGHTEAMCVARGELFIANLANCSYKLAEGGEKRYLFRNGVVCATIDRETFDVMPLQNFILVNLEEDGEKRALRHASGGDIWLPTSGFATDDEPNRNRHGLIAEYGVVVAKGPGCWKEGNWHAPTCGVNDLVLYDSSFGTLPVTIKGKPYTLVMSDRVAMIAESAS